MIIRPGAPDELPEILDVVRSAFAFAEHSNQTEHILVEQLFALPTFNPTLSLVADVHGQLVGYVLLTPVTIQGPTASVPSLALAPVAVRPPFQRKGIGKRLIVAAHRQAVLAGATSVVVLGNPHYYERLGYRRAADFGITLPFDAPSSYCMVTELVKGALADVIGTVTYPNVFMQL